MQQVEGMEEWRDISGYPGYSVSTFGNVRGPRSDTLTPRPNNGGYLQVALYRDKKRIVRTIHRLVGETFLSTIPGYTEIDHINRNKVDNNISNLRWANRGIQGINKEYNSLSGERHIRARGRGYNVRIERLNKYATVQSLADAIHLRDEWLTPAPPVEA